MIAYLVFSGDARDSEYFRRKAESDLQVVEEVLKSELTHLKDHSYFIKEATLNTLLFLMDLHRVNSKFYLQLMESIVISK
jgi:hypothetical protein